MLWLLRFLPRKLMSRWVGAFVHWRGPRVWALLSISIFARRYRIAIEEAERPLSEYPSIGDFFVRRLKPGLRPLAAGPAVHPADSRISQSGVIEGGNLIQAKGKKYTARDLLVDPDWGPKFEGGFFITYYLCPTDYHRVHSPVDGLIRKVTYVPGDLWPVNETSVNGIENLFAVNERVVVDIATNDGAVAVVFVGATNVGSIALSFDSTILGNAGRPFTERCYDPPKEIRKGEELGMFRMGSTVVLLLSPEFRRKYAAAMRLGPQVKVKAALVP